MKMNQSKQKKSDLNHIFDSGNIDVLKQGFLTLDAAKDEYEHFGGSAYKF